MPQRAGLAHPKGRSIVVRRVPLRMYAPETPLYGECLWCDQPIAWNRCAGLWKHVLNGECADPAAVKIKTTWTTPEGELGQRIHVTDDRR